MAFKPDGHIMRYNHLVHFFFPFLSWLRQYTVADFKRDAGAGFTVALVLIPQSMANAQLAGLPAYHGLYAALLPAIVGGLWGSSRHMVSGIGAVIAMMSAAALESMPISGPQEYIAYMVLLTLLVGGLQLLMGVLRIGMVVNFLSLPVIAGFINAAALIIAASQVGKLFGVSVESAGSSAGTFLRTLGAMWTYSHWPSVLMAAFGLTVILLCTRFVPKLPAVLTSVVVCTLFSWAVGFEKTVTVSLDQVRSQEALALITRLDGNERKIREYVRDIAELERHTSSNMQTDLQRRYTIEEEHLRLSLVKQETDILRQHLRLSTFTAVTQADGRLFLFLRRSPDIRYVAPAFRHGEANSDEAVNWQDMVSHPERDERDDIRSPGDVIPAGSADGPVWRLKMGSGPLDSSALSFSGGGAVVGAIPGGLPGFTTPALSWETIVLLLPQALVIAFIGFAESISIAKGAARSRGYRIDANQELVGQGLANLSGALVMTCPVSGSFSSSAVNLAARARTGLSCAFASVGALAVLLFLTDALYYLPQPVLAVIVVRAVTGIMHFEDMRRLWATQRADGVIALITFVSTLFFAPHLDYGIGIGVLLSIAWYFYRSMHPRIAILSNAPDNTLRDASVYKLAECRHIAVIHFQGPLFFGNTGVLEDYILRLLERKQDLRHIHLVCTGITSLDASGEDSLEMLVEQAHKAGVDFSFSGVVGDVAAVLEAAGVLHMVGFENVFLTPREAVCVIYTRVKHCIECNDCPFSKLFCRKREVALDYRSYYPLSDELFRTGDAGDDPWQATEKENDCK